MNDTMMNDTMMDSMNMDNMNVNNSLNGTADMAVSMLSRDLQIYNSELSNF